MMIGLSLIGVAITEFGGGYAAMTNSINHREAVIAATFIGLDLGVSFKPEVFALLPVKELFQNPICMGGTAALPMNLIMPLD